MSGAADPRRRRRRRHDTTRKEKTLSATVAATSARAHARNDLKISTTLTYYAASSRRGAASSSLHDTRCAGASPPSADHPPHPPVRLRRPHEGGRDARELRARHLVRSATLRPLREASTSASQKYQACAARLLPHWGSARLACPAAPQAATTLPRIGVRVRRACVRARACSRARARARARPRACARPTVLCLPIVAPRRPANSGENLDI